MCDAGRYPKQQHQTALPAMLEREEYQYGYPTSIQTVENRPLGKFQSLMLRLVRRQSPNDKFLLGYSLASRQKFCRLVTLWL